MLVLSHHTLLPIRLFAGSIMNGFIFVSNLFTNISVCWNCSLLQPWSIKAFFWKVWVRHLIDHETRNFSLSLIKNVIIMYFCEVLITISQFVTSNKMFTVIYVNRQCYQYISQAKILTKWHINFCIFPLKNIFCCVFYKIAPFTSDF